MFEGFWNALGSVFGASQTNKNIDKQLKAQANENRLNRAYNLQLANMQNNWNIAQWNRENAYNSPSAQMERMRQAGLNPDMMYGGGVSGNLAASSPQMTSGAPSSPMDWSALGSKRTVGDALMQKAQLDQMNAQTDKIKSETEGQNIQNKYADIEHVLGIHLDQSVIDLNSGKLAEINKNMELVQAKILNTNADSLSKVQEVLFRQESFQHEIRKLAAEANISEADATVAMKTIMSRIGISSEQHNEAKSKAEGAKADADLKKFTHNKRIWDEFLRVLDLGIDVADVILEYKNFGSLLRGETVITTGPKGVTVTEKHKN